MAITFNKETKTFYLDGKGITYAFMINDFDVAEHLYYSKTIAHDYREPTVQVTNPEGGRT